MTECRVLARRCFRLFAIALVVLSGVRWGGQDPHTFKAKSEVRRGEAFARSVALQHESARYRPMSAKSNVVAVSCILLGRGWQQMACGVGIRTVTPSKHSFYWHVFLRLNPQTGGLTITSISRFPGIPARG